MSFLLRLRLKANPRNLDREMSSRLFWEIVTTRIWTSLCDLFKDPSSANTIKETNKNFETFHQLYWILKHVCIKWYKVLQIQIDKFNFLIKVKTCRCIWMLYDSYGLLKKSPFSCLIIPPSSFRPLRLSSLFHSSYPSWDLEYNIS